MCGWPLLLVFVGGLLGGLFGGLAYGINVAIYKSDLETPAKVVLNILTGAAAILLWYFIAASIRAQAA